MRELFDFVVRGTATADHDIVAVVVALPVLTLLRYHKMRSDLLWHANSGVRVLRFSGVIHVF